jgi:hypothetical protein
MPGGRGAAAHLVGPRVAASRRSGESADAAGQPGDAAGKTVEKGWALVGFEQI